MGMIYIPDGDDKRSYKDPEVLLARAVLKERKEERKKKRMEERRKHKKYKPFHFSFLETTGMVFLFSIPVVLGQLWFLNFVNQQMSLLLHAPH